MSSVCTSTDCGPRCNGTTHDRVRWSGPVKPPVERTRRGFRINLDVEERELIHRLLGELRTLLVDPEAEIGDARMRRLFPAAYHQDGDRELDAEYQRLMRDELVTSRVKGIDALEELLAAAAQPNSGNPVLDEAQLAAFMQAVNGVRLVLGTIIDIDEEHDVDSVPDDHPLVGEYHLYDFLSWVLDSAVRAMMR